MARETEVWTWLSKATLPRLHMQRIENGLSAGTPDVEVCCTGLSGWLELKSGKLPVRSSTPIRFPTRTEQIEWMDERVKAGGRCGWLLLVSGRITWHAALGKRRVFLLPGWYGADIHRGLTFQELEARDAMPGTTPNEALLALFANCNPEG